MKPIPFSSFGGQGRSFGDVQEDLWAQTAICERIGTDEVFAQHVYAALCNQQFVRVDESAPEAKPWACSWRAAGEIIANIRNEFYNKTENPDITETYVHWYCSGMGSLKGAVEEGVVTEEIRNMFHDIGWTLVAYSTDTVIGDVQEDGYGWGV